MPYHLLNGCHWFDKNVKAGLRRRVYFSARCAATASALAFFLRKLCHRSSRYHSATVRMSKCAAHAHTSMHECRQCADVIVYTCWHRPAASSVRGMRRRGSVSASRRGPRWHFLRFSVPISPYSWLHRNAPPSLVVGDSGAITGSPMELSMV